LSCVVGFGGCRDVGGLVLGFSVGGESGSGIKEGKFDLPSPDVLYRLPIGKVAVVGGEDGIVIGG
jgi:hypothetical protein